jgi:hypothetical protein
MNLARTTHAISQTGCQVSGRKTRAWTLDVIVLASEASVTSTTTRMTTPFLIRPLVYASNMQKACPHVSPHNPLRRIAEAPLALRASEDVPEVKRIEQRAPRNEHDSSADGGDRRLRWRLAWDSYRPAKKPTILHHYDQRREADFPFSTSLGTDSTTFDRCDGKLGDNYILAPDLASEARRDETRPKTKFAAAISTCCSPRLTTEFSCLKSILQQICRSRSLPLSASSSSPPPR